MKQAASKQSYLRPMANLDFSTGVSLQAAFLALEKEGNQRENKRYTKEGKISK